MLKKISVFSISIAFFGLIYPTMVLASDFTGMLSLLTIFFVIIPISIGNLILMWLNFRNGKYTSIRYAKFHSCAASIPLGLVSLVVMFDFSRGVSYRGVENYISEIVFFIIIILVLLILAWLPMWWHYKIKKSNSKSPRSSD